MELILMENFLGSDPVSPEPAPWLSPRPAPSG
jgi:hypothetical protein